MQCSVKHHDLLNDFNFKPKVKVSTGKTHVKSVTPGVSSDLVLSSESELAIFSS